MAIAFYLDGDFDSKQKIVVFSYAIEMLLLKIEMLVWPIELYKSEL